jgi:hypothetical protein
MKTFVAIVLLAMVAHSAHAQSRDGAAGTLGSYRPTKKPTVASVESLDRAKKLADQARARTGAVSRKSSWAYGAK